MTTDGHAAASGVDPPGRRRLSAFRRARPDNPTTGSVPVLDSAAPVVADERATETAELRSAQLAASASGVSASPAGSGSGAAGNARTGEPDWMTAARREADRARHADSATTAWSPGSKGADAEPEPAGPSLVRPYARTGGRTKPVRDLSLEALVRTSVSGKEAASSPWLSPEHSSIIKMCSGTASVAEIAARLAVPLGVARVIIADMVDLGLVEVMKTSATEGDERDPDFLRRVLSGLQRL